jgi:hypothetical protein
MPRPYRHRPGRHLAEHEVAGQRPARILDIGYGTVQTDGWIGGRVARAA